MTTSTVKMMPAAERPSSIRMIATMGIVATISGVLLVLVYQGTFDIIEANKRQALEDAVFTVLPGAVDRATFAVEAGGFKRLSEDAKANDVVYAGYNESGDLVGVAIMAAGQGYQDIIQILVGYDPASQKIIGYKLLASKETPGLGDRIGKDPAFLKAFDGLDVALLPGSGGLINPIEVVKENRTQPWQIDGISGATISSRAVGAMLNTRCSAILPLVRDRADQLRTTTP